MFSITTAFEKPIHRPYRSTIRTTQFTTIVYPFDETIETALNVPNFGTQ
jgi:hypothetical protein